MTVDLGGYPFALYPQALVIMFVNCNYNCYYCIGGIEYSKPDLGPLATGEGQQALVRFFDEYGPWHVILDGGEPSMAPGFYSLLTDLGRNHVVTLHTNLTLDMEKFAGAIKPESTGWLMCSLHPEGEKEIDSYFERIAFLKKEGYRPIVRYVADPYRLARIDSYLERCREMKVGFLPAAMYYDKGRKHFPESYSDEQRRFLKERMPLVGHLAQLELDLLSSYDWPCRAGRDAVFIDGSDGNVYRCVSNRRKSLGNVFDNSLELAGEDTPCDVNVCGCDLYFFLGYPQGLGELDRFRKVIEGYSDPVDPAEQQKFLEACRRIDEHGRERNHLAQESWARQDLADRMDRVKEILSRGRFAIYGAGSHTRYLFELLDPNSGKPATIIDSDRDKWGTQIDGFTVGPPEDILRLDLDGVLISSATYEIEIFKKLRQLLPDEFPILKIYND